MEYSSTYFYYIYEAEMNVTACDGFIIISVETARSGVENLSIQSREISKRNL